MSHKNRPETEALISSNSERVEFTVEPLLSDSAHSCVSLEAGLVSLFFL